MSPTSYNLWHSQIESSVAMHAMEEDSWNAEYVSLARPHTHHISPLSLLAENVLVEVPAATPPPPATFNINILNSRLGQISLSHNCLNASPRYPRAQQQRLLRPFSAFKHSTRPAVLPTLRQAGSILSAPLLCILIGECV